MALQKQAINVNFQAGLDTKTDPFQVARGKFLALKNTIFDKIGLLKKRNGFKNLATLPDTTSFYSTTFNGNLVSIGSSIEVLSSSANTWVSKGTLKPVGVSTTSLIRSNTNQTQCDSAIATNGLVCTVFTDAVPSGTVYKYAIADSATGQNIISPVAISVSSGTVSGSPRVFAMEPFFVIVFDNVVAGVHHLDYIAINTYSPTIVTTNASLSSAYTPASRVSFDGVVANGYLYLFWNSNVGGGAIDCTYLTSTLTQGTVETFTTYVATAMSVCADTTGSTPIIYAAFWDSAGATAYVVAVNQKLATVLSPTAITPTGVISNITCSAQNAICTVFYEINKVYSYDGSISSNYIEKKTVTQGGTVSSASIVKRSVGLASKSFIYSSGIYLLSAYSSPAQPTYFLLDSSGNILAKVAYTNGGGYLSLGLPSVTVVGSTASVSYLIKDLIASVNKAQGAPSSAAVYSQTGINMVSFNIGAPQVVSAEIGGNLNISGGFLWSYDGGVAVEQGFHVYPDSIECTWNAAGGAIHAQPDGATNTNAYFYQVTYEWGDNQGNVFRSAPSIPVALTTTGAGVAGSITVNVPTLRLTYKTANPVKIVIYRWSIAQQSYYQVTSLSSPTLNDPTVDSIAFVDTLADASILGNSLIYTTGGVVENTGAPAAVDISLFKSRLILVDAEDRHRLWYSKLVVEASPVEMSDLFTIFIAPSTGAQGSTGGINFTTPLDDKLIIFKDNAIYYMVGNGPDATGANNDFSEPVFITSTVGSSNSNSIVFIPTGILFQSSKGIWHLGRDLQTKYIGFPVEDFNQYRVLSAINIPGSNQVRFTMSNGETLMYDYFMDQWGTFDGIAAIASTIYQGLHTFINKYGQVLQETPGVYLDGSSPVLVSFSTSWFNMAGLQGYQRAYFFNLLAQFLSPHKIEIKVAYDYAPTPSQAIIITPNNYSPAWGGDATWGSSNPFGGPPTLEQYQIFFNQQLCQSFQITLTEIFDPSIGIPTGAGFSMSGLNVVVGMKKGYKPFAANRQVG